MSKHESLAAVLDVAYRRASRRNASYRDVVGKTMRDTVPAFFSDESDQAVVYCALAEVHQGAPREYVTCRAIGRLQGGEQEAPRVVTGGFGEYLDTLDKPIRGRRALEAVREAFHAGQDRLYDARWAGATYAGETGEMSSALDALIARARERSGDGLVAELLAALHRARDEAEHQRCEARAASDSAADERERNAGLRRKADRFEGMYRDLIATTGHAVVVLDTARREHVEDGGSCVSCGAAWPCAVLTVVNDALSAPHVEDPDA